MLTEAATCPAVTGLDVGKFSHWACYVTRQGEVLASAPVANTEHDLDALFAQAGAGTLVVVDQARNIGSLAISRARLAGLQVAYPARDKNRLRSVLPESCPAFEALTDLTDPVS